MAKSSKKVAYDCMAKVVVLGDSSVGKTNILLRFTENEYRPSHMATIGIDFKNKGLQIDGRTLKMQVWDTAGQERFRTMAEIYYKNAAGIVLVYSVGDRKSFNSITTWLKQIAEQSEQNIPKVLVGNKCDLQYPLRLVSTEEGKLLAAKHNLQFIEASAQQNMNIQEIFTMLGRMILNNQDSKREASIERGIQIGGGTTKPPATTKSCC